MLLQRSRKTAQIVRPVANAARAVATETIAANAANVAKAVVNKLPVTAA